MKTWKQLSTRICAENNWLKIREDKVLLPSGDELESYFVIEYPGAVAILVIKEKKVLMVRQYRYPFKEFMWEIPCGSINENEDVRNTAFRELREETGFTADKEAISVLSSFAPSPGSSNEIIHICLCTRLLDKVEKIGRGEIVAVQWMELEEVIEKIMSGEIKHSPTIVALFHLLMNNQKLLN